jgi:hypothetical protein
MIEDGHFSRVDVDAPGITTTEGVQVGDSEAKALQVYGPRLKVEPHHYIDDGHYLTVRSSNGRYGMRFETEEGEDYELLLWSIGFSAISGRLLVDGRIPQMDLFFTVLGLPLLSAPLLLIGVAGVMYRKRLKPLATWRRRVFLMTLAASALNYATVWLDILVVPHLAGSILNTYIAIGRTGEFCSIALFAALAGTGTARVYAVLAAAGLLFMWMGVGFYSF